MKKTFLMIAASAIILPSAVTAKDVDRATFEKRAEKQFVELDLDGSGAIDGAELEALVEDKESKRADRKDEEMRKINEKRVSKFLEGRDTNGDGAIDLAEFKAEKISRFESKDTNGNGILEEAEKG